MSQTPACGLARLKKTLSLAKVGLVKFEEKDLFDAEIRNASVVTLYLLPNVNLRLRPKLLRELKPGARVVSHSWGMGDWKPDKEETLDGRTIYPWTIPAKNDIAGSVHASVRHKSNARHK